jgi:dTDP-4-amino-4,6-dideoxygalactose transaminase
MRYLDEWSKRRQQNAAVYDAGLAEANLGARLTAPRVVTGVRHIFNQYVVRAQRRDGLRAALAAANVGTEIYYPVPLHLQECFAYLGQGVDECPESARAAREVLALPIYPELTAAQQRHVVDVIRTFYADGD